MSDRKKYKLDDGTYVISEAQVWIPGCYASEDAADLAFELPNETLSGLQETVNPGGVITLEMLRAVQTAQ